MSTLLLTGTVPKKMKISLVTTILLSLAWGKHLIIKTKDPTNNEPMDYAEDDATNPIHGKPTTYNRDYDLGGKITKKNIFRYFGIKRTT